MTGLPVDTMNKKGRYRKDTLFGKVLNRLLLWDENQNVDDDIEDKDAKQTGQKKRKAKKKKDKKKRRQHQEEKDEKGNDHSSADITTADESSDIAQP